ncbi:hypothetical protein [Acinetobacter kyonggiensis]|uniref:Uncharacterized protein n=1 Tax=Acinetobacter kyonggiensis TaxID=595670 RepID=A0A1H3NEH1_9GAMM|nr:hypothetical protein [Acinetobacter kyonggiensis]SDY87248.1 hypothetical protein SAMN05421643_1444 [Acinetobacter kyonggiensis]
MAKSRNNSKANNDTDRYEQREKDDSNLKTKITLGFDFFLGQDTKGIGQTWEDWHQNGLIVSMLHKLKHLCTLTPGEAKSEGSLKIYGDFPPNSKFKCPQNLKSIDSWGTIRQMGNGGKTRIAGFYDKNYVFRVVFLDKKHEFWPTD